MRGPSDPATGTRQVGVVELLQIGGHAMTRVKSGRCHPAGRTIFPCLLTWAVITELRKPEEERAWHGKLGRSVGRWGVLRTP